MSLYICSLANNRPRTIPANTWVYLPFPYEQPPESYDPWNMHREDQPGGRSSAYPDKYSALIHPQVLGYGTVEGHVELEAGDYTEVRTMFSRDPFGTGEGADDRTNDEHHAVTPGMQFLTTVHRLWIYPSKPMALMLYVAGASATLAYSQFKLDVNDDVAAPSE